MPGLAESHRVVAYERRGHGHSQSGVAGSRRDQEDDLAALDAGVRSFESSFGELGGCPVPKGAAGNIASEDLISMLHEMGYDTGVDLQRLLDCARRAVGAGASAGQHVLTAGPVNWRRA